MWKEYLKKLIPILRHRPTVLRLHQLLDALRGIPAHTRVVFSSRRQISAANIVRRNKRIVFISDNPLRREGKFAYALKRAGWDVILLRQHSQRQVDTTDYTDVQIYSSSWEAIELAHKIKARLFHNFSASYDNTSVCLMKNKPGRVIFDFYDYFYALSDGLPVREKFALEIAKQRYCIEHADAICVPDLQMQYRRRETKIARGKPVICFPNYCWNRETPAPERKDREARIVQIGWMEFGEDVGSLRVIREFVEAGCHFHIYLHPGFPPLDSRAFRIRFEDYLSLQADTGRLYFHPTLPGERLVEALMQYDYGFNMIDGSTFGGPWKHHNPYWLPLLASGRLYDYLDAGLPSLCDGNLAYNRHLFGRTAFIDGTRLIHSGNILERLSQKPPRDLMLAARTSLAVQRHIWRLTRFYDALN
jgi:hypothetical protein